MTETDHAGRCSGSSWSISVAIAVVFYLLSPGIFVWADAHGQKWPQATGRVFDVIYVPIGYLNDHVPAVKSFYNWYFRALGWEFKLWSRP